MSEREQMKDYKSLIEMKHGQMGVITNVYGGRALCQQLDAMHIIPGARIRKVSGSFMGGPVTVQIGSARLAIGYGMAARIILKVEDETPQ